MSSLRRKAVPRPLPVVLPGGVVVYASAYSIPPHTCHLSHCPEPPAPGPTLLCAGHLAKATVVPMQYDGNRVAWGACLRGCGPTCELGHWTGRGAERHYQPPKSGCEHLPAHLINLARGIVRRRAFVQE
jgi:hypothetical protein